MSFLDMSDPTWSKIGSDSLDFENSGALLTSGLLRLSRQVERLVSRVETLEIENKALRSCLETSNVLRPAKFEARLHEERFLRTLRSHPCAFEARLPDVLLSSELRSSVGAFTGWGALRQCAGLQRSLKDLTKMIPQMIYVCGGFDGQDILSTMVSLDPRDCRIALGTPSSSQGSSKGRSTFGTADLCLCGQRSSTPKEPAWALSPLLDKRAWTQCPPLAQKRAGFACAVFNGCLYVCGGFESSSFLSSVERFRPTPQGGCWEEVAAMGHRRHCAAAVVLKGRLLVCGGYDGTEALQSMEVYKPVQDAWELATPMAQRRHGAAAAVVDGKLIVCGGFDGRQALRSCEIYDPSLEAWSFLPPMRQSRNMAFAVTIHGRLFVCGGCNNQETLRTTECLDWNRERWDSATPLARSRHGAGAAVVSGQLYVFGGGVSAEAGGELLSTVERFEPAVDGLGAGMWHPVVEMPVPRVDMAVIAMCAPG